MARLQQRELTYQSDSSALFERLRDLPYPVFLDSAFPYSERGRFDIISAAPIDFISSDNSKGSGTFIKSFDACERLLKGLEPTDAAAGELPFHAGIIGGFGYDGGRRESGVGEPGPGGDYRCPDFFAGLYSWALVVDHKEQRRVLVSHPATPADLLKDIEARLAAVDPTPGNTHFRLLGDFHSNLEMAAYRERFDRVQDYIRAGDCYQINLARRFEASCQGDAWQAYRQLRMLAAAPYSAYLELPESQILSFSPERFIAARDGSVTTTPIKGTAPRSAIPETDQALAAALQASEKDRAENLMIVDLLRNDIGRCCRPGSIRVEKLFELQSFQTVHHLVSTIRGELPAENSALNLLAACFPGGSITGAPKRRAMEIIHELEPHERSIYCGSIAYIGIDGNMDSNIAIRTLLCEAEKLYCWSGGGIVADSEVTAEFEETWNKVGALLNHLKTMR